MVQARNCGYGESLAISNKVNRRQGFFMIIGGCILLSTNTVSRMVRYPQISRSKVPDAPIMILIHRYRNISFFFHKHKSGFSSSVNEC